MNEINLQYLGMRYFIPAVIMITVLLIGVMMVSATPNSNFPNTI
jgi:hypothetical protein